MTTLSGPLFSVVIPTFNRGRLVPFAIRSVLSQTCPDLELIICDNYSEDDTRDVVMRFRDKRVRYVRTPRHFVIADNFEFALSHAVGKLVIVLSDDDVLIPTALERFAKESIGHAADFLFSGVAEYRDGTFPGLGRNTLSCYQFTGQTRGVDKSEFLGPLFDLEPRFNMHPSAFAFSRSLATSIVEKAGRFFQTNGVEYYAWPMVAVLAKQLIYIDMPLVICGRTGSSWGTNLVLANPGKKRIEEFVADVDHNRKHAPLNNFSFCNLMAEGMLTAKHLLPQEFSAYEFNEANYLRKTFRELISRRNMGVDVARELNELLAYAQKYPALWEELTAPQRRRSVRSVVANLGGRHLWHRLREMRQIQQDGKKVKAGDVHSSFWISGKDFGFNDILGGAGFLDRLVSPQSAGSAAT